MLGMKKWKTAALAASVTLCLALAGCGGSDSKSQPQAGQDKKVRQVGIVQFVEHGALDAANKGFVDGLASKGFKENETIQFDRQNAQADQSNFCLLYTSRCV